MSAPPESKKADLASVFKFVGLYFLVWLGIFAAFIGYVTHVPNNVGHRLFYEYLASRLLMLGCFSGLIVVLTKKYGVRFWPRGNKEKNYFDEISKQTA